MFRLSASRALFYSALAINFAAAANAQDEPAKKRITALEEVVVTAQKREESLQDAPISISAFGYEELEKEGITNIGDIGSKVPNLDIAPFPTNNTTLRMYIRGIGVNDVQITQDPSIGVYTNGVYIARSTGLALDVADLERIEVLRGPQGTLYGRNSTGGAVNIVTRKPSTEGLEFKQVVTVGDRDLIRSKTTANIPLTEDFAVKIGYLHYEQDGFVENTGGGSSFGDKESDGGRIDLLWRMTDGLMMEYAYDYSEFESTNYTYQAVHPKNYAISNVTDKNTRFKPVGSIAGIAATEQTVGYSDKRQEKLQSAVPMRPNHTEIEGHSLTFTWDFDLLTFKSISAYRELSDVGYADLAGGANYSSINIGESEPSYRLDQGAGSVRETYADGSTQVFDFSRATTDLDHEQYSQEFQFLGTVGESWDYILGLYYFKEKATEFKPLSHQSSALLPASDPNDPNSRAQRLFVANGSQFEIENEAWAAFIQTTWTPDILDQRLHITLGARHSADKREATRSSQQATWTDISEGVFRLNTDPDVSYGLPPSYAGAIDNPNRNWPSTGKGDWTNDSFLFVAAYDFTDDVNGYFKISEAYKSGGFNTREPSSILFQDGFDPETVTNYEFGLKGEFLDRRLRANAAVFQTSYQDMQFGFLEPGTIGETHVFNAGEATIDGFELDMMAVVTEGLVATFSYGYLNPGFDELVDPNQPELGDQSSEYVFPQAAKHSYNLGLDYVFAPMEIGELSFNVSYNWTDERAASSQKSEVFLEDVADTGQVDGSGDPILVSSKTNKKGSFLDDYGVLNARLTLSDIDVRVGTMRVSAWVKNLEDKQYEVSAISNLLHADRSVIWGEPRSYGVDFSYEY